MKKRFRVSFDFDGTLDKPSVQNFVKILQLSNQFEIWIVTSRWKDTSRYPDIQEHQKDNKDLFDVAKKLNIPKQRIHFTNQEWKYRFFAFGGFLWHLDDNQEEIQLMIKKTTVNTVSVNGPFVKKCLRLWKDASFE